jgi:A-macroglobulin TED domain/Alpha-2-macroglobulin family/Carboxypeptidase regulatory-like domain/MG2 domain/A-macroglobulin receptor binding domain/Macroglobulin domain MG3
MRHLRVFRRYSSFAVLCLALLAPRLTHGQIASASPGTAVRLRATTDQLALTLRLPSPFKQATRARIELKLLNPEDAVRAATAYEVELLPGQAELVASLPQPFASLSPGEIDEFEWMRLQYEVRAVDGQVLASGIEALRSQATIPFVFTAAAPALAPAGKLYQVRVHAKAREGRPLRRIVVQGELTWEEDRGDQKLSSSGFTDGAGNATLDFTLPGSVQARSGDLRISAMRGLVARSVQQEVRFSPAGYLLLDTDKDIYQPGQAVHARILHFDSNRKAVDKESLDARITDEEDTLVSRQAITTDSFGVARLDWTIPANVAQGNYTIKVGSANTDEDDNGSNVRKSVHIYRYDLPNFRVKAQSDHPYYLPAQNAEVTVSAEYLFGKPVARAKVRVVEETERTWNYREQKWELEEQQVQTGELDRDGHFTARFDLGKIHVDLKDRSYERFRDVDLAAYVTDLTTGRTEQRRFSLRVTKDPIHIYVTQSSTPPGKLLRSYYISTFYADGRPAICKVRLSSTDEDEKDPKKYTLRVVETNKYGLVKVTDLKVPDDENQNSLLVEATDRKGLGVRDVERIYRNDFESIEVTTSHAIHKPGDPIEVTLRSVTPTLRLIVQAVCDGAVLATQQATLRNGRASLVFPYDARFNDEITIVAFSLDQEPGAGTYFRGAATVLYPKNRQLGVAVQFDKDEHRPGEEARLQLAVRSSDRNAAPSVLGIKIVDSAVEERARTDSDFGHHNAGDWWRWSLWSSDGGTGFGGISRDDLDKINLTQPVPPDLDAVAEYILNSPGRYEVPELLTAEPDRSPNDIFKKMTDHQFETVERGLKEWNEQGKQPRNDRELAELGNQYKVDIAGMRDPWGTPYKYTFRFEGGNHIFMVTSAGPDKKFGTGDDFTAHETQRAYFLYYGNLLKQVGQQLMDKENRFIRDQATLEAELLKRGVDFQKLRDPWDTPYESRFPISASTFVTQIMSHGEDRSSGKQERGTLVWEDKIDYFRTAREHIDRLLNGRLHAGGAYPQNGEQFKTILRNSGVDLDGLRDPWGSPYYVVFTNMAQYGDRVTIRQTSASGERNSGPVTLIRKQVLLMSPGPDKQRGGNDDFQVASYSVLVSEQSARDVNPEPPPAQINLTANTGAITGTVMDPSGAVIPGAWVQAGREGTGEIYSTRSDSSGSFELKDMKPGNYQVEATAVGFQTIRVASVSVRSMQQTELSFKLSVGTASETVEVTAAAPMVETSMSTVSRRPSLPKTAPGAVLATPTGAMSTPRLRHDFPETMLWEPELVTDHRGRVKLDFKMADNITTWKLTAIASTKNGELGSAEKDLRAFQPFFLEHDPPRVLTQDDEISYPVVLRNYLDRAQTLKAWIKPESWFTLLGPAETRVKVDAGDAANAIFRYRAAAAIVGGKQQVSAANTEISDAAEKPVDVHPNGRPVSVTTASVLEQKGTLVLEAPQDAINGSLKARVKIYPNLLAHVVENLEAGLAVPHGCGEQTISSTYPSLLVTEFYASSADKPVVARTAQRYLQAGYERLLRYQDASGGFTYWGHGDPDLTLTAYALEFLNHADRFIEVDSTVIQRAENWVLARQGKDGSWLSNRDSSDKDTILETAYIAETLALIDYEKREGPNPAKASLQKALGFMAAHRDLIDEPYVMASYALAAKAASDEKTWAALLDQLRRNVHHEDSAVYWALERNTPFYGWGSAGRLESTALALRALATAAEASADDNALFRQGLLFLLRNEDKEGMWYSGQTTVHVLKTLLSMSRASDSGAKLRVRVNDKDAATLDLPGGRTVAAPLEVDVTALVKPGENRVQIESSGESMISAQFVADAYVPWRDGKTATTKTAANSSSALKFSVVYSALHAKTGDKIECRVRAERLGYRGYGMMLGEIGLPPGADVDRESLERALAGNHAVYRYDVMPDRVVVYLWPMAGGSEFTFQFRPRFAMSAETAPSLLYDYYNPEASVMIQPVRFEVEQAKSEQ